MTGNSILREAAAFLHETDITNYQHFARSWLNTVLIDVLAVNNNVRENKGLDPIELKDIVIDTLDETLNVEDELRNAVLYGLLCKIYVYEDDKALLNTYLQQYEIEKKNSDRNKMRFVSTNTFTFGGDLF